MRKQWKKIHNKLRGKAGETIAETLISLLVAALALVMLAGAVSAGGNAIISSRKKLADYYRINEAVAKRESVSEANFRSGSFTLTFNDASTTGLDKLHLEGQTATYYENAEFNSVPVLSYKKNS